MKSREIFPIDRRLEKPYGDDESLDCLDDFDIKYNIGNPKDYVILIDKYHKALEAAEKQIESLGKLPNNKMKKEKPIIDEIQLLHFKTQRWNSTWAEWYLVELTLQYPELVEEALKEIRK